MSNLWTDMYADRNEVLVYIHAVMLYKFHLSVAQKKLLQKYFHRKCKGDYKHND